ncbi:MarR family winged helix-turn-helix transcriptional regulator [Arthrobacter sp. TWP1-1]|uniref:MarR family winged helix-turn-helix transcriptional regulator n=1 Tax=Arthrobacter sp. TWP1-1 TaxID=2804568 RepID=UPI003CF2A1F1
MDHHALPGERERVAWRSFDVMQQSLRRSLEQHLQATSGLSVPDYDVLAALAATPNGRRRFSDLSDDLGWERSRLHHQLTRMCRRGLVRREPEGTPPISREVFTALTEQGHTAVQNAAGMHAEEVRRLIFEPLTATQIHQWTEISDAILGPISRTDGPEGATTDRD